MDLVINWHITEACNYQCFYCFAKWQKDDQRELLHSKHEIIRLSVVDFNGKAISFYEKNNFLQIGKKEGKIANIIMEKNIYESRNI